MISPLVKRCAGEITYTARRCSASRVAEKVPLSGVSSSVMRSSLSVRALLHGFARPDQPRLDLIGQPHLDARTGLVRRDRYTLSCAILAEFPGGPQP